MMATNCLSMGAQYAAVKNTRYRSGALGPLDKTALLLINWMNEYMYQEFDCPSLTVCRFVFLSAVTARMSCCSKHVEMSRRRQLTVLLIQRTSLMRRQLKPAARDSVSYSRWCHQPPPAPVHEWISRCTRDMWSSQCETRVLWPASPAPLLRL